MRHAWGSLLPEAYLLESPYGEVRVALPRLRLALRKSRPGNVADREDARTSSSTVASLPRCERLERNQEREDAGTYRGDKGKEQDHYQSEDDKHDLGGWQQVLQLLKSLFQMGLRPSG
jgi:hypothetical protein